MALFFSFFLWKHASVSLGNAWSVSYHLTKTKKVRGILFLANDRKSPPCKGISGAMGRTWRTRKMAGLLVYWRASRGWWRGSTSSSRFDQSSLGKRSCFRWCLVFFCFFLFCFTLLVYKISKRCIFVESEKEKKGRRSFMLYNWHAAVCTTVCFRYFFGGVVISFWSFLSTFSCREVSFASTSGLRTQANRLKLW